jgi:membrane-associated phospholipid phosphatase
MQQRHTFRNSFSAIFSMLVLVVIFYSWLDVPVEHWFLNLSHGWAYHFCKNAIAPIFGSHNWLFAGVISLALGLLLMLFGQRRMARGWLFFSVVIILSFILCTVLKFILARYRPELYFTQGFYGFHFFSLKHSLNSMPSGHATLAFARCYALAKIAKRKVLTILLLVIASLIAFSRLVIVAHYPSDIILGAYIGLLSVYWVGAFFPIKRNRHLFNSSSI